MRIPTLFVLLILSFFVFYTWGSSKRYEPTESFYTQDIDSLDRFDDETKKGLRQIDEEMGYVPPQKDGFFEEFGQGMVYSVLCIWSSDDTLNRNQQLKPYRSYEFSSSDPVDIARTIGTVLGMLLQSGFLF